eukprot:UN21007
MIFPLNLFASSANPAIFVLNFCPVLSASAQSLSTFLKSLLCCLFSVSISLIVFSNFQFL